MAKKNLIIIVGLLALVVVPMRLAITQIELHFIQMDSKIRRSVSSES